MRRCPGAGSNAVWLAVVIGASTSSCRYDANDRCGPHQQLDGDRCICVDGYGLVGVDCVACGANEVGGLSGCSCAPGYARPSPTSECEEQQTLGQPCQSDEQCQHPVYSHCQLAGDEGYCTSANCSDSSDCQTSIDYACNDRAEPSFCERPPSGLGTPCSSSSQCEGFEASYCEALSAKVCLPNGCKQDPDRCHGDWVCCDIQLLGQSLCIPPSELEDGACPAAGVLIERAP